MTPSAQGQMEEKNHPVPGPRNTETAPERTESFVCELSKWLVFITSFSKGLE